MDTSNAQKVHKLKPQWYQIRRINIHIIALISGPAKHETLCPNVRWSYHSFFFFWPNTTAPYTYYRTTGYNIIGCVSDFILVESISWWSIRSDLLEPNPPQVSVVALIIGSIETYVIHMYYKTAPFLLSVSSNDCHEVCFLCGFKYQSEGFHLFRQSSHLWKRNWNFF